MLCQKCQKPVVKRDFTQLFTQSLHIICRNCFKQKLNIYPYMVIPINGGLLHIFELTKDPEVPYDMYYSYFKPYIAAYLKTNRDMELIIVDELDHDLIDVLDQLKLGHLFIFTLKFKEE